MEDRYARERHLYIVLRLGRRFGRVCPDMQELSDGLGPHPSPFSIQFFGPFILILANPAWL